MDNLTIQRRNLIQETGEDGFSEADGIQNFYLAIP